MCYHLFKCFIYFDRTHASIKSKWHFDSRKSNRKEEFEIVIPRASLSKDDSFGCSEYWAICAAMFDVISPEMRVEDTCELNLFVMRRTRFDTRKPCINIHFYRHTPPFLPLQFLRSTSLESFKWSTSRSKSIFLDYLPFPISIGKFERIFALPVRGIIFRYSPFARDIRFI